jgi:hypothetical protein
MRLYSRISPGLVLQLCGVFSIAPRCHYPVLGGSFVARLPAVKRWCSRLVLSFSAQRETPVRAVATFKKPVLNFLKF